ncbi:MAG: hypothetical protein JRC89_12425 [Deltaproteobacteria bacterium]|nr:hypothetical protein [Deltaproteobacteria bacterium]
MVIKLHATSSQNRCAGGIRVMTRLMGLLLSVLAVQFMVSGFQQILIR